MSRTLWFAFAFLFNIGCSIAFFLVCKYQFDLINQGLNLTWSNWSYYGISLRVFDVQVGQQAANSIVQLSQAHYPNYITLVFSIYFSGNMGFLRQLMKAQK